MRITTKRGTGSVQRISISLPEPVFRELDQMVAERGLQNRSKAIAEMISRCVLEGREVSGDPVMAGMVTLVYDEGRGVLARKLLALERTYRQEVISSLHVQLEDNHRMEVIVVQGPIRLLKEITDRILACKGVLSCKLTLTGVIIPRVHSAALLRRDSLLRAGRNSK